MHRHDEALAESIDAIAFAPRDARYGQAWSPGQRLKNNLIFSAISVIEAIGARLREPTLRAVGRAFSTFLHAVLIGERKRAIANVIAVRIPEAEDEASAAKFVRRNFRVLGDHLGSTLALFCSSSALKVEIPGSSRAVLTDALNEGRGALFVSAHLGPWEHVAAALVEGGYDFQTLARESYDKRLTECVARWRMRNGVRTIHRQDPALGTKVVRALRRNGLIGVVMDLSSRVAGVAIPFLGRPAHTPIGPARIALSTRAAILVGTPVRCGERILLEVSRIPTSDLARGDEGERTLSVRINHELSARIRKWPDAWIWMHNRW